LHRQALNHRTIKAVANMKPVVSITIEDELLKRIDKLRGDIPRSIFIQRILEKELE
jgi:metal-responsive CopG/Arc/MetJ family transcriptional regulator